MFPAGNRQACPSCTAHITLYISATEARPRIALVECRQCKCLRSRRLRPIHLRASSRLSGCCCVQCGADAQPSPDIPRSIPRWNGADRVWLIRLCSSDMGSRRERAYTKTPFLFHRRDGFRNGFVRSERARLGAQCCRSSPDGNKRAAPVFALVTPRSKSTGSFPSIE
jgi:hypothetical protein